MRVHHIRIGDATLEYRRIEGGPGPVLVFLHEGLGSVSLWRDFPDRLARACGLAAVVYSRAGYGGSSPVALPRPLDYMSREAHGVLPALLDALGLAEVILVGHSDGASISLIHAGHDGRSRVRGVVAMAPHSFVEPLCLDGIRAAREAFETGDLRARLARHHGDNVDCAFWGWNRAWLDPNFAHWDIRADLAGIRAPVLVIQGWQDEYGTEAQVRAVQAAVPAGARALMLENCAHSPHRDQPQAVMAAIADFVAGLTPPREG